MIDAHCAYSSLANFKGIFEMNTTNKALSLAICGAFVATIAAANIQATENPFAIKSLSNGYHVADATAGTKMKDGKCGTGNCGANKKAAEKTKMDKGTIEKSAEGSCSADKMKDGNCSAEMNADMMTDKMADKAKDGSCHAAMKGKEGSCHSDKK